MYIYSRAMKFAAMSPESFARESGRLASFSDCQYRIQNTERLAL